MKNIFRNIVFITGLLGVSLLAHASSFITRDWSSQFNQVTSTANIAPIACSTEAWRQNVNGGGLEYGYFAAAVYSATSSGTFVIQGATASLVAGNDVEGTNAFQIVSKVAPIGEYTVVETTSPLLFPYVRSKWCSLNASSTTVPFQHYSAYYMFAPNSH